MFASIWRMGRDPEALNIRRAVFIEELRFPEETVFEAADDYAAQLVVKLDGVPVASARLTPQGKDARLSHIAVLPGFRGQGFGDLCARQALNKAQAMGVSRVLARVPAPYRTYYEAFGFRPAGDGDEMAVEAAKVVWHSPCKEKYAPAP